MIPRPPFADELTREQELAAFERLKPRLNEVWDVISAQEDLPATSIVVPSFTLDQEELTKLEGAAFYEERLLFLLIRLRNPRAHVTYVTSQPVHPLILDYYLHLLAGVPASHARARLTMLCAYDSSPRPLTQKILERPRLIERIRQSIPDSETAYLTVFNSTPLERKLAVLLDIPLNGLDPELNHLGTKSGSRKVFREAGVPHPPGYEDLKDKDDVERALVELGREHAGLAARRREAERQLLGRGQRRVPLPGERDARRRCTTRWTASSWRSPANRTRPTSASSRGWAASSRRSSTRRTSCRRRRSCAPRRAARSVAISTHDQILGGPSGQIYLGCTFPAHEDYRRAIQDAGDGHRPRAGGARRRQPLRRRLPGVAPRHRAAVEPARARDQPAGARHHASVPRAAVPHRRPARPRFGPVPLAQRPRQVLHGHRQPARDRPTAACCPRT